VTGAVPALAGAFPERVPPETASAVTSAGVAARVHAPAAAMVCPIAPENAVPERAATSPRVTAAGVTVTVEEAVDVAPEAFVAVIVTVWFDAVATSGLTLAVE
jgi:hypothetical protein